MSEEAKLHDRATRGEHLADEERAKLERWYRLRDEAEAVSLAAHRPAPSPDAVAPVDLKATLARIREAAQSLETLHRQNTTLREEIAALQKRLAVNAA